jgi:hypothetical protein
LRVLGGNPGEGRVRLALAAPAGGPVTLKLLDVAGRVLERHQVEPDGREARLVLGEESELRPGIYFVEARQGEVTRRLKTVLIR